MTGGPQHVNGRQQQGKGAGPERKGGLSKYLRRGDGVADTSHAKVGTPR